MIRKTNFGKSIILHIWHPIPLERSFGLTRCCKVPPLELGHNGHKRRSCRRYWLQCPKCGKEGWEGDVGYVDPALPIKYDWMPT